MTFYIDEIISIALKTKTVFRFTKRFASLQKRLLLLSALFVSYIAIFIFIDIKNGVKGVDTTSRYNPIINIIVCCGLVSDIYP